MTNQYFGLDNNMRIPINTFEREIRVTNHLFLLWLYVYDIQNANGILSIL